MPQAAAVVPKAQGQLKVQMDALWSFVDHKGNKQWVWVAIDADTRAIIGCHIGDRSRVSAMALWRLIDYNRHVREKLAEREDLLFFSVLY